MAIETTGFMFLAFGCAMFYLANAGRDNRVFRIFFMVLGFLSFYATFSTGATLTTSYTVPVNSLTSNSLQPYYSQAAINSLTPIFNAFDEAVIVAVFLYLAIEIILFVKNLLEMRRVTKQKQREEYGEIGK